MNSSEELRRCAECGQALPFHIFACSAMTGIRPKERTRPSIFACSIVSAVMHVGSTKDGTGDDWWRHGSLYHLVKGMSHLASHIKYKIDPRKQPEENHLHKAITRLAMAASIEQDKL